MKFSVVTPTYNHKKYIETTIKSVVANKSDGFELEYIIVDGGSTDGTQDVVEKYIQDVDKFISEPDDGQADAINKGFSYATGDIYGYINSDDYYYPKIFEDIAKIFEENPNIDVVYGNCTFVNEDEQFHRYFTEVEPFDKYRLTSCSDFIMQPTTFWRAKIFNDCNGFNKDMHFGFDWDMWCRMAQKGAKFFYAKDLLIAVNREFEETKTLSGGNKRLEELKKIIEKNKESSLSHAYYSYAFAEESSSVRGITPKKLFYKIMSYENILYNHKTRFDKHLYGVLHHRPVLEKSALISIPWYNKAQYIFIQLSTPPALKNQSVKITINDKLKVDYTFNSHSGIIFLNIEDVVENQIDVKFEFEKETVKHTGLKQKLLDRVFPYAAFLSTFTVLSENNIVDSNIIQTNMSDESQNIKIGNNIQMKMSEKSQNININNISLLMNNNKIEHIFI